MRLIATLKAKFDLEILDHCLIAFINAVSFTIIIPILYPYAKEFDSAIFKPVCS